MAVAAIELKMRAVVAAKPGPVATLKLVEVDKPEAGDSDIVVRVHSSSANPVDLFPTTPAGYLMGGRKPQVLGTDFAGVVEATGKSVTRFQPGDEVFGGGKGTFAEFVRLAETAAVVRKPPSVPFDQAGAVTVAGSTALQALRDHGRLKAGQSVLINGASGGVGTFAVQIAKALGAEVTAVCRTRNVEMVRSLGADKVIDYTGEDFTRGGARYDLILDIAASHSLNECRRVLQPAGTFVGVGAAAVQHTSAGTIRAFGHFLGTKVVSLAGRQRVVSLFIAKLSGSDLEFLGDLLESGRIKSMIERSYDLDQVPEALAYLNEGHARGKLAIRVA